MGWLGDGVRGGGGVLSKSKGGFLETWHSERARFYSGRRGCSPSFPKNLALWLRPASLPALWEPETRHFQARVTQVRPLGRPAGPTLDNADRAPPPRLMRLGPRPIIACGQAL